MEKQRGIKTTNADAIQCVACNWVGTREETVKIRTHKLRIDRCDCPECGCSTFYENKKKSWLSIWK